MILQLSTPCTDPEHPKTTPRNDCTYGSHASKADFWLKL